MVINSSIPLFICYNYVSVFFLNVLDLYFQTPAFISP